MSLDHYHYADGELAQVAEFKAEDLNWLVVAWDMLSVSEGGQNYAQFIVGPGAFLHRYGPLTDAPFDAGATPRYLQHQNYPSNDGRTMLEIAIDQSAFYEGCGYVMETPPTIIDFSVMAEEYESDMIRTMGDLMVQGRYSIMQDMLSHISAHRNSIHS